MNRKSGPYRSTGILRWWDRVLQIMTLLCGDDELPPVKLHGLRMLAPAIIENVPLSSADSAMVARNVNRTSSGLEPLRHARKPRGPSVCGTALRTCLVRRRGSSLATNRHRKWISTLK